MLTLPDGQRPYEAKANAWDLFRSPPFTQLEKLHPSLHRDLGGPQSKSDLLDRQKLCPLARMADHCRTRTYVERFSEFQDVRLLPRDSPPQHQVPCEFDANVVGT